MRKARTSPQTFRRELLIPAPGPRRFGDIMQPWQEDDFAALDPAWLRLAGRIRDPVPLAKGDHRGSIARPPCEGGPQGVDSSRSEATPLNPPFARGDTYQRAYIERPRGHAKTSDMAVQLAWILLFATDPVEGLAAAADRDQGTLIRDALERIARLNRTLCAPLEFRKHAVFNRETGSKLEIISSDVQSSWGALPDFVICDELCHWEKPDMWFSLLSSAAKRPHCILAVLTNAGVGRGWQWDVRESARTSDDWYFSSLEGSQAPWISPHWLQEQQNLLPRPVYDRLWRNLWQHSDGEFVTLAEAEACRDPSLSIQNHGQPGRHYGMRPK